MITEADERRLTPAVWAKWDAKLYNWALCGYARGIQRASVEARRTPNDEHWTTYCDRKPGTGGQAATYETEEPPGINVDAIDVDALVIRLSDTLREAVEVYWGMTGPYEYRAVAIGCHVNTLRNRARAAVVELETMDGARRRVSGPAVVIRSRYVPDDVYD